MTSKAVCTEEEPRCRCGLRAQVYYGRSSSWYEMAASGNITSYVQTYPGASYVSGTFHHVKLTGLSPDTTYFYRCGSHPWVQASCIQRHTMHKWGTRWPLSHASFVPSASGAGAQCQALVMM